MTQPSAPPDSLLEARLGRIADEFTQCLQRGESPDVEEYARRNPEMADVLRPVLAALQVMGAPGDSAPLDAEQAIPVMAAGCLGDFRILREIGRGGMGVVYEAEQISLSRRVALKVLPFAAALDSKQIERFKNEAQAAAHLHHQHIVPVYAVGCERGVHYYAMQYIEGRTLATLVTELRALAERAGETPEGRTAPYEQGPAAAHSTGAAEPAPAADSWATARNALSPTHTPTTRLIGPIGALSTERSTKEAGFFNAVAKLGIQAAEALDHAHQLGIVHRDIKPGNLLVDARGHVWITDFGLAQVQGGANLTMSGDLLGTLRYMSPEQALAQRVGIDHRTDVYSLGATIYELLTQEPAFPGRDRQELLRQIAFDDPRPLRRLNLAVPVELETIIGKAMEKNPAERYATAQEMADDLQRYLKDEPIRARRPTLWQKAKKWARRNRPVVWSAGVSLAVVALLTIIGLFLSNLRLSDKQAEVDHVNRSLELSNDALRANVYYYAIALAERELAANHAARAEELLDSCRPEQRGWEWHFLKRRIHEEPRLFTGHTDEIEALAFSPNGQVLASAAWDATVRLWETSTGKCFRTLKGKLPGFSCLAYSPDGQHVAAGDWSHNAVTIWDLAAPRDDGRILEAHTDRVGSVAFSPDGSHLAWASNDRTITIWDLKNYEKSVLAGHDAAIRCVAYSPDGSSLVSNSDDQTLRVWDVRTGRIRLVIPGHRNRAQAVTYSPDGRRIASTSNDRTVRIWDAESGKPLWVLRGHTSVVGGLAYSPDGRRLVSSGEDATVRIWDPLTGQETLILRDHTGRVDTVAFSPDGRLLASGGSDVGSAIRVWNATPIEESGEEPLHSFTGHEDEVKCLAFSQDGLLASGGLDRCVRLWDVHTGALLQTLRESACAIWGVAFSPDGKQVAANGEFPSVRVWEARTGRLVLSRDRASGTDFNGIAFDPNGRSLALADFGGCVRILDSMTGKELQKLDIPKSGAFAVAYDPKGGRLAAACDDLTVRIWELASGAVHVLSGHKSEVTSVAYRSDGARLASTSGDGALIVWDPATSVEVLRVLAHRDYINAVAFSPDGRRLATASRDGSLKLWNADSGALLRIIRARQGEIFAVAFHPNGKLLASAGVDGKVRIWDVSATAK